MNTMLSDPHSLSHADRRYWRRYIVQMGEGASQLRCPLRVLALHEYVTEPQTPRCDAQRAKPVHERGPLFAR